MKYICGLLILIYGLNISAQQTHVITGYDHYFSPDTAYVNIGDTVRLVSLGYHSITEQDSIDWVNNASTDNGGFWIGLGGSGDWFTVNQSGKYYFNCPENPVKYLESKQRYGINSIQSPAKRGVKPLDFQNCQ